MSENPQSYNAIPHCELGRTLLGDAARDYDRALPVLAANPGATNKAISIALGRPLGSLGVPCRAARDTLGIDDGQGSSSSTIGDKARYVRACAALGVAPQDGVVFAKVHDASQVVCTRADSDPLDGIRRLVRQIQDIMPTLDIEHVDIATSDVRITRTVRTKSVVRL
jgi:hypothetical protein